MLFEVQVEHSFGETHIACNFASAGRVTALVGPSGQGKTSVLNAIAGLLRPDAGRIAVSGEVLFDSANGITIPPEKRRAAYVFQDARLFPHMNVSANLSYGAKLAKGRDGLIAIADLIDLLGIGDLLSRYPATLSGGETRRVAIGRALLSAPRFMLLDEPMASLDEERAERMRSLIEQLRDELDLPILLVSHDAIEVERLADQIVRMGQSGN